MASRSIKAGFHCCSSESHIADVEESSCLRFELPNSFVTSICGRYVIRRVGKDLRRYLGYFLETIRDGSNTWAIPQTKSYCGVVWGVSTKAKGEWASPTDS